MKKESDGRYSGIKDKTMDKKLISVMTPCYNEEANIMNLYHAVKAQFEALPQYAI